MATFIEVYSRNQPTWICVEKIAEVRENTRHVEPSITITLDNTSVIHSNETAQSFFDRLRSHGIDVPPHPAEIVEPKP